MSPSLNSRKNASRTARAHISSIVKRRRSQSADAPIRLSCSVIVASYSSLNDCTRATNASRPYSCRPFPSSSSSRFSTRVWVAIPAWSVPGSHSVSNPIIRCARTSTSCSVPFSACPI